MSDTRRQIDALKEKLAKLDEGLVGLLEERARLAKAASALRAESPGATASLLRLAEAALAAATGDMPPADLRRIVGDIQAACASIESPSRIVFSGSTAGAAHAAIRRRFGATSDAAPRDTAAAAIDEVVRKRADIAVVPLESSDDGPVQGTVLALSQTDLKISEILEQNNELNAWRTARMDLSAPETRRVRKLFATRADLDTCSRYVASLVAEGVEVSHTASSIDACRSAASDPEALAIALDPFGIDADLMLARPGIGDMPGGRIRFGVVGARPHPRTGDDATALVFTVRDSPGSLLDVLKQFAEREINLTNIYSRPILGGAWAYLFFVEISGHFTDRSVVTACEEVRKLTTMCKIVGAYPSGYATKA